MGNPNICRNCDNPNVPVYAYGLCEDCYAISVIAEDGDGNIKVVYTPQPHQQPFHESNTTNLLALGTRGTGKSTSLRWDAIIRCLIFPRFKALILRRTLPELRISHLNFIAFEMDAVGGRFLHTTSTAIIPHPEGDSKIVFSQCETMKDIVHYLSSEWDYIGFDEVSTFPLEMFLLISAAARSPEDAPYHALVRCCSNPLGIGAAWMKAWFIDHNVDPQAYPDYVPDDFEMQFSTLDENRYVNRKDYEKRLRTLPEHVRKAWLRGEFVIEGAYFSDFRQRDDEDEPWHVIQKMPRWGDRHIFDLPWVSIYRAIDWGYYPDPAVCLWIALLPNKRAIVFQELTKKRMLAKDFAAEIKRMSKGMHIVETFADPTMNIKTGVAPYSIGDVFETNGIPLTYAQNDRELYGYAVHEFLNTMVDGAPQLQILDRGCPELIRTFPIQQMDPNDSRKLANGEDHWVVALAYFCMGQAMPARDPSEYPSSLPLWMQPKRRHRLLGV